MEQFKNRLRIYLPLFLLVMIPSLIQLPALLGTYSPDPLALVATIGDSGKHHSGNPWIDPNVGFQGQALGKLSADQWLGGHVPWWNTYNGVGLPLAAEAQPASLFLPFVLLMHFRDGGVWLKLLMQIIAGLCTFALLRRLGLTKTAALAGALLFELNGTLGWHGAPIMTPVAFLPMLLLGVEQVRRRVTDNISGGWLLIPLALAWSIYAGFPETAYIDGLLAGIWVLSRFHELDRRHQLKFARGIGIGVLTGLLCSAPLIIPFAELLSRSFVGGHGGSFAHAKLPYAAIAQSFMPWLYGPIAVYEDPQHVLSRIWGGIGGYVTALEFFVVLLGAFFSRRWLYLALLTWMILCVAKTFDVRPISDLVNLIPLIKSAAFFRYCTPSMEFAVAVLAAMTIDGMQRKMPMSRLSIALTMAATVACVGAAIWLSLNLIHSLLKTPSYLTYFNFALGWLAFSLLAAWMVVILNRRWRFAPHALVILLALDTCVAFVLPIRSGVRRITRQENGIAFLREHVGLDRIYSLGPLAANYGAFFNLAQINYNYLPVPKNWVDYIHAHINPKADPIALIGVIGDIDEADNPKAFRTGDSAAYEALGVKYVLVPPGTNPFTLGTRPTASWLSEPEQSPLDDGQSASVSWTLPASDKDSFVDQVTTFIGRYEGQTDGLLAVRLCNDVGTCSQGQKSLIGTGNSPTFRIDLDQPLSIGIRGQAAKITATFQHGHSTHPMSLWLMRADATLDVSLNGKVSGPVPLVSLRYGRGATTASTLAYSDENMDVYQLPHPKPYFEVVDGACTLQPTSRLKLTIKCASNAYLLRREAFYPGWTASVDGATVPVDQTGEIFQGVTISKGAHSVAFSYRPTHAWLILIAFATGIFGLLLGAWRELSRLRQTSAMAPAPAP